MIAVPRVGDLDPVAVAPDAGVHGEVGSRAARAVRVAPEADRHRRHRLGDHELADLADQLVPVLVEGLDVRAERARLQLALVHRQRRHAADERRADVRPAAGREQPGVARRARRRPSEKPSGDSGEPVEPTLRSASRSRPSRRAPRPPSCTRRCSSRSCRSTSSASRSARSHSAPEVRVAGVAVVEDDRGVGQQHADEEVPHHPAGRREPEDAVARPARRGAGAAS